MHYSPSRALICCLALCALGSIVEVGSDGLSDKHSTTRAVDGIAGIWTGVDTATGSAYYRMEVDRDGNGFIGMAAPRFPVELWNIRAIQVSGGSVFTVSLAGATTNTQARTATIRATNYFVTEVLELRMTLVEDAFNGRVPVAAQKVLLRRESELRSLDQDIRTANQP
jgi:hypothetical protein